MPRNALGRGLGALIREPDPATPPAESQIPPPAITATGAAAAPARQSFSQGPHEIDIDLVEPSPYQPRTRFAKKPSTNWGARFRPAASFNRSWFARSAIAFNSSLANAGGGRLSAPG